jgi:Na+-translocating ferredoxin:NAD+ oxidoreductase RnfD subunit
MGVMTGMTFVLYTFYMITDPGTTPVGIRSQIAFGLSVGLLYGVLVVSHVVFGMFFALTIVCLCRGMFLAIAPATLLNRRAIRKEQPVLAGVK